jgi:diguanylate cyclase (GGDEF)-like protein
MVRREQPAGLIMMDLDHFKTFNDTFGHEGGDALLRRFGQFLRDHLRKEDIACRYGGEEFCVLFCESSPENTLKRADQLRADMRHLDAQHGGQHLGVVTVSIGVACYPIHGNTIVELIAAADTALYQAKAEGRDRVVTAAMPVPALASVDFVTP